MARGGVAHGAHGARAVNRSHPSRQVAHRSRCAEAVRASLPNLPDDHMHAIFATRDHQRPASVGRKARDVSRSDESVGIVRSSRRPADGSTRGRYA
jgi:hypothetical protein